MSGFGGAPVPTQALWTWDTPAGQQPVVQSFPTVPDAPTKSGLGFTDLQNFLQIPIQQYTNPPVPIPPAVATQWIRWAEDEIEADTNIRLCQTWIAAPPARTNFEVQALNLDPIDQYQQLGIDFDYQEPAYDFEYERARDEGWLYLRLRWRPVKGVDLCTPGGLTNPDNYTGIKNIAFIYPLLNEYFRLPQTWIVEDQNRGLVRMVPATSVQMLPLFAMQLTFLGFAQSVPGGLWLQYTAGLTTADYQGEWSFMQQLILAKAGMTALSVMQTSINFGVSELTVQGDGLMRRVRYPEAGPFSGQINNLANQVKTLTRRAKTKGGGFFMGYI